MLYLKTMKLVTFNLLVLLIPVTCWGAGSQSQTSVDEYFTGLSYGTYSDLVASQDAFNLEMQPADTIQLNQDIYGSKTKSTRKAFIYSLLLPGAGELYGESKLKAAAFLSLEALFWVGYFHYDGKGDDTKKAYQAHADTAWDPSQYRDSLVEDYLANFDYTIDTVTITYNNHNDSAIQPFVQQAKQNEEVVHNMEESLSTVTGSGYTHHSVSISKSEFYENIGKYDQFRYGWIDFMPGDVVTALRRFYLDQRHDANSFYDKAKWSVVASMANHIISAIDAALTVKSFNRKQDRFKEASIKIRMVPEEGGLSPRAVLTLKFD